MTYPNTQAFMDWFAINRAPAELLARLHAARGATVPYPTLNRDLEVKGRGVRNRAFTLHEALEPGSLVCVTSVGYRLTAIGLAECERAIDDFARRNRPTQRAREVA